MYGLEARACYDGLMNCLSECQVCFGILLNTH